jgi:tRNA (cmo5U34)-methyltransferase
MSPMRCPRPLPRVIDSPLTGIDTGSDVISPGSGKSMQFAERAERLVQPRRRWTFDAEVTRTFDDMLRRSIPEYDAMRAAVFEVGKEFVRRGTTVVDLGCSRGGALAQFVDEFGAAARYVGVDVSQPMLDAACARFRDVEQVEIKRLDLRDGYPDAQASLTLAVLTLQFTPVEHRTRILEAAYEHTLDDGALVLVEKVLSGSARMERALTAAYEGLKRGNGYTQDEIDRKRLSLEGVLVPLTARWNEELLGRAGFRDIECVWRSLNFAAWLAIK